MGVVIGTAGWSIPRKDSASFPTDGAALERYARIFGGVEINSSFYRSHRPATWARWAASVPDGFRFAVKVPKAITHAAKLVDVDALVAQFAAEIEQLGAKLDVLLVQLPPKLGFDPPVVERFFTQLRHASVARIVCEPRHASWFEDDAEAMLVRLEVSRAGADPAPAARAAAPGGWAGLAYWRLHGSPAMYRSAYDDASLDFYASEIMAASDAHRDVWCIFDNTAASAATGNALALAARCVRARAG